MSRNSQSIKAPSWATQNSDSSVRWPVRRRKKSNNRQRSWRKTTPNTRSSSSSKAAPATNSSNALSIIIGRLTECKWIYSNRRRRKYFRDLGTMMIIGWKTLWLTSKKGKRVYHQPTGQKKTPHRSPMPTRSSPARTRGAGAPAAHTNRGIRHK